MMKNIADVTSGDESVSAKTDPGEDKFLGGRIFIWKTGKFIERRSGLEEGDWEKIAMSTKGGGENVEKKQKIRGPHRYGEE